MPGIEALFALVLLGVVVWGYWQALRALAHGRQRVEPPRTATDRSIEEIERRYARGEITQAELEHAVTMTLRAAERPLRTNFGRTVTPAGDAHAVNWNCDAHGCIFVEGKAECIACGQPYELFRTPKMDRLSG